MKYHYTVVQEDGRSEEESISKDNEERLLLVFEVYYSSVSLRFLSLYFFPYLFLIENLLVILIITNYNSFFDICARFIF